MKDNESVRELFDRIVIIIIIIKLEVIKIILKARKLLRIY